MKWISKAISVAQFPSHLQQSELQKSEKAAKKQTEKDHFVQADCLTEVTGKVSLRRKIHPPPHTFCIAPSLESVAEDWGGEELSSHIYLH